MKKILLIIQARMSSTRLPGKVLLPVLEKPLIWYLFERLKVMKNKVDLVLATTVNPADIPLIEFAKSYGIKCFAGSENDVLDRFYQTAKKFNGDILIRVTGDCPLIDPFVIDAVIDFYMKNSFDYVNNTNPPTFPDGLDTEIFSFKTLDKAWNEAKLQSEREHVTPYIYKNRQIFKIGNYSNTEDWSKYRLTVDEKKDFDLIAMVINNFKDRWQKFTTKEALDYLNTNPTILDLNKGITRNEGYDKSLKNDKNVK